MATRRRSPPRKKSEPAEQADAPSAPDLETGGVEAASPPAPLTREQQTRLRQKLQSETTESKYH